MANDSKALPDVISKNNGWFRLKYSIDKVQFRFDCVILLCYFIEF